MRSKIATFAIVLSLTAAALWAQEFRGTVTGHVLDAQKAVVPNVKLQLTEVNTGANYDTVSGSDGLYTVPFLAPGLYRVTAEASGFKRYVREGLRVSTNERVGLDIQLDVGQVVESVTITSEAPILQTATASTGQVIDSRQVENMPLNGRTPMVLAQLAFGVIPSTDPRFTRPFDNAGPAGISMGGAPSQSNELLLDGASNNTADGRVAYNPPVDAVAEVKVEAFQADAAYGHTGGGTVNVVMRSGTNALHGSAYWFNQVSNLTATPFFTNRASKTKANSRYNQYGMNAGGPMIIPKVLDGRNRAFFYFAYEGVSNMLSKPIYATVPTVAEKTGDFSALLAVGSNYTIYDPNSGVKEGTHIRRQPFSQNKIPADRLNAIAQNYIKMFWPVPNVANPGKDGLNNYFHPRNGELSTFDNEFSRFDFNLSDKHKLFWNFRHNVRYGSGENGLGWPISSTPSAGGSIRTNWASMLDDVYTFTPTLLLNTRLSWTRYSQYTTNYSENFDMTSLGFPAYLKAASIKAVLPSLSFSTFRGLGASAGGPNPEDVFQIFATVTKILSRHSLKMGADLRQLRNSQTSFGSASGSYTFSTNWTKGPLENSTAAPLGQDFASFLLGLPTSGSFDVNSARTNRAGYYALFLQDDFQASRNLTLNLGLRYEIETPTTELYNRTTNGFDFTTPSPISAAATAAYALNPITEIPAGQFKVLGGLLYAGPNNRALYTTSRRGFSPRVGFAWTPSQLGGKTVFRGGMGIFFSPYGVTGYNQTGFNQRTDLVPTNDGYLTPYATLSNPFPQGIQEPIGSSAGLATYIGRSVSFFNPHPGSSYSLRWNFDVQRELARNLVLEAGYTGNRAVRLTIDRQLDYIPRQYLSTSSVRDTAVIGRLSANVTNPFANLAPGTSLNGSSVKVDQLLRPYPQFTGLTNESTNAGSSYFHSMQVRVQKRFSHGLQVLANYSFSKLMGRTSYLNPSDPMPEKRIQGEDRPHRLVVSASYELPFGRGRRLGANVHPVINHVIGGWSLNVIYTGQSSAPINWNSGNPIYYGGDLQLDAHNVDRTFDKTRFNTKSTEQLDSTYQIRTFNSRFANLRIDRANNYDLSAIKDFRLLERLRLQFRGEFFNAFNHPEFSSPNVNPTSSDFGKITSQANNPRAIQLALRLVW